MLPDSQHTVVKHHLKLGLLEGRTPSSVLSLLLDEVAGCFGISSFVNRASAHKPRIFTADHCCMHTI